MRSAQVLAIGSLTVLAVASPAFAMSTGFVENRGQVDDDVLYYAAGSGVTVYLIEDGIVLDLRAATVPSGHEGMIEPGGPGAPEQDAPAAALRIHFADASPAMRTEARNELPTRFNFFHGNDPAEWRVDVPCYEEVVYRDIRPGVDLVLRIEEGEVIYELAGAAGGTTDAAGETKAIAAGEAKTIAGGETEEIAAAAVAAPYFVYEGAEAITNVGAGEVHIVTAAGTIVDLRSSCESARGRLVVLGGTGTMEGGAAPAVMRDEPDRLLAGTYIGGSDFEWGQGIGVLESGEIIVGGYTQSSDYPTTPGAYDPSDNPYQEVVVSKLSSAGDSLLWSTYLGGGSSEQGGALVLDAAGNPIVTGATLSTDFPTTAGAYDRTNNGGYDLFVTKLSSAGNAILWSTLVGGSGSETPKDLVLDAGENVVVTGQTGSANYPTTAGAYDTTPNGGTDVLVSKISSTGSALLWSTVMGGASEEYVWAVGLDPVEDVVISGYATASSFPTTPGAYDVTYNGGERDAFAAKFSSTGSTLLWSTFLGGSDWDWSYGLDLDAAGNPVLTGGTWSANFPTTAGAYDRTFVVYDIYVSKLASTGNALLWSTFIGGDTAGEEGYSVVLDEFDRPVLTGYTGSSDFPTTADAYDRSFNGNGDIFVSRLSSTGSSLLWSSYAGGSGAERGWTLALDPAGNPLVTGHTESTNFPTTPGAYDTSFNGRGDLYVLKLDVLDASGIPPEEEAPRPCLLFAGPNPFSERAAVRYVLPCAGEADLRVLDIAGRAVAELGGGLETAGAHSLTWLGVDDAGRRLPAGVYVLQLRTGQGSENRQVVIAR